jgi:hypothetical protein
MSAFTQFVTMYREGKIRPSTMAKAAAFKEELEKIAGPDVSTFLRYLATGLAVSAGIGVAAAGAKMGIKAYEDYKLDSQKDELFREVLKLHPDLIAQKERAKMYFAALIHFSPVVASNPLAAGAYIKQALQYDHVAGGPLPQTVNELTQIQKQTMDARKNSPLSPLGTVMSGIADAPNKMVPGFMSFSDFSN